MDQHLPPFFEALRSDAFTAVIKESLPFILGANENQEPVVKNLVHIPHMLIAGATGTGKSTLAHAILLSLIDGTAPRKLKLILCDTKGIEFSGYNNIAHLLLPVATDPRTIQGILQWTRAEAKRRLDLLVKAGCRSIENYNEFSLTKGESELPRLLIVIDDVVAAIQDNIGWNDLQWLTQNGRNIGIHLLLITQTPGHKRLSEIMNSAIPARAVFNVFSNSDEKLLLGSAKNIFLSDVGEVIFCLLPSWKKEHIRCYPISDDTIRAVTSKHKVFRTCFDFNYQSEEEITSYLDGDEMLPAAIDAILETGQASVSMLQRQLKLGYARAARIVDELEEKGIVGPFQGSNPREILITKEQWQGTQDASIIPASISVSEANEIILQDNHVTETELQLPIETASSEAGKSHNAEILEPEEAEQAKLPEDCPPSTFGWYPTLLYVLRNEPMGRARAGFPRWFFTVLGIIMVAVGFGNASIPSEMRIQFILYGICVCTAFRVSFLRWVLLAIYSFRTGCICIGLGWDYLITCAFLFCIAIVFGRKAVRRFTNIYKFGPPRITLHQIDLMTGLEFEHYTADLLRDIGYSNVTVTKASGDQGVDVLAEKNGVKYAFQCKHYSRPLGNTPVQEIYAGKAFYGCDVGIVITNSTFTPSAYELADSLGVILWDRDFLHTVIYAADQ